MTDDHPDEPTPSTVHLHRQAERDDMHRVRVILSTLWAITDDDWRCDLQRALLLEALHVATCACKIEVSIGDDW